MTVVVSLKDVVDAIDLANDECVSYINPISGEIVTLTGEDRELVESESLDPQSLPEWQRESLTKSREVLESGAFLELPTTFDIHEWAIMDRFASRQEDAGRARDLRDAIRGPGAFATFRSAVRRLEIEDDWFQFRQSAFEAIAKAFLETREIRFE